jgi:hypothetical protein
VTRDLLRLVGFLAAFGSALIHLVIAPEHMAEAAYVGVLFVVGGVLLGCAAGSILASDFRPAWNLGAALCAGMVVALVLSRTTGLPGGYREGWDEPEAVVSLALELLFLGVYVARVRVARLGTREEGELDAEPAAEVQALGDQHDAAAGGGGGAIAG